MCIEWSIKLSLLMYAMRSPGGGVSADGVRSENGQFLFPVDRAASSDADYVTTGSVALFAHYGMPITTLGSLRVHRAVDGSWLLAVSPDGQPVEAFALGAPREEEDSVVFDQVTLTAAGVRLFGGSYATGEAFDPLRIRMTA